MNQKLSLNEAIKLGFKAFNEGKLQESERIFISILKANSKIVGANYGMALICTRVGEHKKALSFFDICQKLEKKNILFFQGYIKTLIKLGQIKDARYHFYSYYKNYENNDQLISLSYELNPNSKLDFFYKYLEKLGIFSCKAGELMKINDRPIPLLTNTFLNWFETQTWSDKKFLELGSGSSTLYFSKFFGSITSLETNQDWYSNMLKEISDKVNLKKTESILSTLEDENLNNYDVILVDPGENRAKISRFLASNNFNGIIFFDNSERYRNSIRILVSQGYYEIPFFGLKPVSDWVACTSVLIRNTDIDRVFNSNWKAFPEFATYNPSNSWDCE